MTLTSCGGLRPMEIASMRMGRGRPRGSRGTASARAGNGSHRPMPTKIQYRVRSGGGPAKGDLRQRRVAELLDAGVHRMATEPTVEAAGALIVRQRPDHQRAHLVSGEIAPDRREQPPAEAQTLEFRTDVELENLAMVRQARSSIAPIGCIAGDDLSEGE